MTRYRVGSATPKNGKSHVISEEVSREPPLAALEPTPDLVEGEAPTREGKERIDPEKSAYDGEV